MKLKLIIARLAAPLLGAFMLMASGTTFAEMDGSSPAICGHGCWAWIYREEDFNGDNDILCGPFKRSNMMKLPNATKIDWSEELNSMKLGPNATLRVWEDTSFEGYSKFYSPGTVKIEFDDDHDVEQVNSIELICMQ